MRSKRLGSKNIVSLARPLCVYKEEASGHSSCPLEAGEAPFLPGVRGIVQQLLLKLMGEISMNSSHSGICKGKHFAGQVAHLSCRLRQHLFPSFLCCWRPHPCKERPWPGRSTDSHWSRRSEPETLRRRVSCAGYYRGSFWDGSPLLATTFVKREMGGFVVPDGWICAAGGERN